jgi:Bacterial mobilisation protein (MobC)
MRAIARLLGQLGKIGSNINQIAHYLNAGRPLNRLEDSIELALRDLAELRIVCLQALGQERRRGAKDQQYDED